MRFFVVDGMVICFLMEVKEVFKNQIIGTANLAFPIIILYQLFPRLFLTYRGIALGAFVVAVSVYALNWWQTRSMVRTFKYTPTGACKEHFETLIEHCGIDPKNVSLFYAYTGEQIALAVFNAIVIDPVVWSCVSSDPDAIKVKGIFDQFIAPGVTKMQEQRIDEIKKIISVDVENFIVRHELAHIHYQFTAKKLLIMAGVGFFAAYISILSAMSLVHISGILACTVAIAVGALSDVLLTWISNVLFKVREEKNADLFAVQFSSENEIRAAADFFEKLQQITDTYPESNNFLSFVPSELLSGHPNGKKRASYLRATLK